jgi:hypothetical protein
VGSRGYLGVRLIYGGKPYRLYVHRIVWAMAHGSWPENEIDHINGIRDDNRLANLREATRHENQHNLPKPITNTSGYPGVDWDKASYKWRARVVLDGREFHIGQFADQDAAYRAYCAGKAILHPFQPVPRDASAIVVTALDRMLAARRIIRASRRNGDDALEFDAWDAFIDAM